jgi:hypothetical protein
MRDVSSSECDRLIRHSDKSRMDLAKEAEGPPSYWAALPLCIIDAVFSIGVRYPGVEKIVSRWCETQEPSWEQEAPCRPTSNIGPTVRDFVEIIHCRLKGGCSYENLFGNRWRTSSRNGILKADAVRRFAEKLLDAGVNTFSDVRNHGKLEVARERVSEIPGQRSGLSFKYFLMLTGEEDYVKPDRHVRRFVNDALCLDWRRLVSEERAEELVREAAFRLRTDYPGLTPARLDLAIWSYQRFRKKPSFSG